MNEQRRDPDGPIISEAVKHQLAYKPVYYTTRIPLVVVQKLGLNGQPNERLVWEIKDGNVIVRVTHW